MTEHKCTVEVDTPTSSMSGVMTSSRRDGVIDLLEATAHVLRVEQEKEQLEESLENASIEAVKLARVVNENLYLCECGRVFPTQGGYAGHQNWCEG